MLNDLFSLMAMAPKVLDSLNKMSDEDIEKFVGQMNLTDEEAALAVKVLKGFKRGEELTDQDRNLAIGLLTKVATQNNVNIEDLLNSQK